MRWKEKRVPSVRELAVELEVNPNTVMRAFEFLQQEQIIFNQRGVRLFCRRRCHPKSNRVFPDCLYRKRSAAVVPEPLSAGDGPG